MSDTTEKITEYLSVGGTFNPESMDHDKVRDLLMECRNELDRLVDKCNKQAFIIQRVYAEHLPDTWFVSGELGEKDQNGLPKLIEVCPAYGCDWVQIYERTDRTIGGMGS